MSEIPYLKPVVIVDVETTGGSPTDNRLIEIGIIRVENGREVRRYQSLINPGQSVPPFVQRLTGISDRDLATQAPFDHIALEVEEILKDALFVGHNARFDYDFIRSEFRRLGKRFVSPTLCSARFSRALFPEHKRHNLAEIIERHGLSIDSHHRALDDAQAVWDFFRYCVKEKGKDKFLQYFEKLAKGRPAQTLIPAERFENIPEKPGVYIFRDANGKAIYVGRGTQLREKILGHFYGDFEGPRETLIAAKATDLEWTSTPGELAAFFLEGEKITELQPQFARKAVKPSSLICIVKKIDAKGYEHCRLVFENEVKEKRNILGFYRGFREAKQVLESLADQFKLCRKLLDLEKGPGPCLARQTRKCSGACVGEETATTYNERLTRAFQQSGVESWPYASAVLLDEQDEETGEGQAFLVQNWLPLARIFYAAGGQKVEKLSGGFDWDKVKILKRAFREPRRVRQVSAQEVRILLQDSKNNPL